VPINGQKPDALIRQTLGIAPGDRLPSQATADAVIEKIRSLGLFRVVSSGLGIENDADKLDWIVCVQQKSEAELVYDEAQRIGAQDSTEAVKQAIEKHKEALLLYRQPKTAPRKYDRLPDQEMKKYRFMSFDRMWGAIFGKLFPTEADCLVKIAANYTILSEFYQALHYYSQALPLMQQLNDQDGEVTILTEMGDIYSTLGDRQQAQQYYKKALTIRLEALKSKGRKPE
jgi:tetratricopeptide (TPR) repeat protein